MNPPRRRPQPWPADSPELAAYLPLIHSAWADGILTDDEVAALSNRVDEADWLTAEEREVVLSWLDPDHPPSQAELGRIRELVRATPPGDLDESTRSLTDLGIALARRSGAKGWQDGAAVDHLRALEGDLGVAGRDAAQRALGAARGGGETRAGPNRLFDAEVLRSFLDTDRRELREEILESLGREPLKAPREFGRDDHREWVLRALRVLAARGYGAMGYPEEFGGSGDAHGALVVFETLAFGDLSLLVKFGVQFGLFGGSVLQLGTRRHHEAYLGEIGSLELPGCYAMTETGHGSNVRDLATTATYDRTQDSLVVDTPNEAAGKDWIGNAALHGRLATVFARLIVDDEDHGVHAVLVPIRDARGRVLPGVRIEDRGQKVGLNGVDNGRIWFDSVAVPRDNLLDRFAQIDAEGRYHSDITSSGRRFFTMLGTLVTGRVSIAAASVSATKTGLTIATRYTNRRRQFGPEGGDEVPLLDYLTTQRALMPRLAKLYGLHFAVRDLQSRAASTHADPELEVRAAGLKAIASEHCVATLQACREACGGQGYLAANRLGALRADTDVFTTFEGANTVLLLLVSKGLLSRYAHEMGDLRFWGTVRYLADRASLGLTELNPVATRRTDPEHLRDSDFQMASLAYREQRLLRSVAGRLKARIDRGMDSFQAMNECQDHLVELARAYVDRVVFEAFDDAVARAPTPGLSETLTVLRSLFALSTLEEHRGWYLEAGYVEAAKSRAIRGEVNALCREVRTYADVLVDAFGIPADVLDAPAGRPTEGDPG